MRIRSIKPEFWTSPDVGVMDWHTRLVFIGLWSYVDDNGVGRGEVPLIVASLFPLDELAHGGLSESSRRTQAALNALEQGGQISQYLVSGRPYLHVTAWDKHQKINRPSPGRYPLPSNEKAVPLPVLSEDSVRTHSTLSAGTEEQGNRGTDIQNLTTFGSADSASHESTAAPTTLDLAVRETEPSAPSVGQRANTITKAYVEVEPMAKFPAVAGIVRKAINCRRYDDQQITDALLRLAHEGRGVTVETLRVELDGLAPRGSPPGPRASTTEQRVADAREAGRRVQAMANMKAKRAQKEIAA